MGLRGIRDIAIAISILGGIALLVPFMHTCERFEPVGELYFYMDTVIVSDTGTYLFSGAVVHTGKEEITQHGFCWSDSREPVLEEDTAALLGPLSEPDSFSIIVSGLDAATTYYVRSFVTAGTGTEYSDDLSFTTPALSLPAVTTTAVSGVTRDSARSGGIIAHNGGSPVTARGVCWDTTLTPTIASSHTTDGSGTGTFISTLTGLSCQTRYYVRAYATNSMGTGYGDTVSFSTSDCLAGLPVLTTTEVTGYYHFLCHERWPYFRPG